MTTMTAQPASLVLSEDKYDALEVIDLGGHLAFLQVTEDGESETVTIGLKQAQALLKVLQQFTKEA